MPDRGREGGGAGATRDWRMLESLLPLPPISLGVPVGLRLYPLNLNRIMPAEGQR
jgi:hypothetical protein